MGSAGRGWGVGQVPTNAVGDAERFSFAEQSHPAVALLGAGAGPVLVGILGHLPHLGGQQLLCTLGLLQAQYVGVLLTHPLQGESGVSGAGSLSLGTS